ncbi:MAG: response regulator [Deltaproteobacteria bacterium]|nr:MAG: response regulator [Deltaproteobacteria bacterium]TMQ05679.1 MAG: response regulator [Deltaproteobacteria bacterium]
MPPGTISGHHRESWLTKNAAASDFGAGGDGGIEVIEADALLGIGLGSDILVVDDDADNLTAYEAALGPLGRRVVTVRSGIHALARLLEQDFALLLLDVSMPDMTGVETARRIRQRARNQGLPIIFITGVTSSTDIILEAYDAGAFDFVIKPIPPAVLRAKARVYLQLQERTYELLRESAQLRRAHQLLGEASEKLREHDAAAVALRSAREDNRRKDEFLGMLSHELRNPLWTMANALELLRARDASSRELAIIERQVEHLSHIVSDLLDFSRITRGKIDLRRDTVDLAGVVADVLEAARPQIERRAHQLTVQVPDGLAVDADRHRIRQVVESLLDNAVKYTADGGRIAIAAARDGRFVRIAVRDNGRGIAASLLPRMFEPFVQGEQPLDRSEGGLGIGLTLVQILVELHGGAIEAHSDGPGTGATFIVRWPAASDEPVHTRAPHAPVAAAGARRVLIVDDNADAADMLAALLRIAGHDVALAHDGAAALALAPDFAPHIALLDLGLPVMDGYELARRLRQLEACRGTLLVALSGYDQPDDRERARSAGFAHHLAKPVKLSTLEALFAAQNSDPS